MMFLDPGHLEGNDLFFSRKDAPFCSKLNNKIKTILVNTTVFYYKSNICLYKMPHVSTFKGNHQARINKKASTLNYRFCEQDLFLSTLSTTVTLLYKNLTLLSCIM
jgi:hypothetical protein